MEKGSQSRGNVAGQVSGGGRSGVQTGSDQLNIFEIINEPASPAAPAPSAQESTSGTQSAGFGGQSQAASYDASAAAAADAAARAAAEEAERRRIAAENAAKRKAKDKKVAEEAQAAQKRKAAKPSTSGGVNLTSTTSSKETKTKAKASRPSQAASNVTPVMDVDEATTAEMNARLNPDFQSAIDEVSSEGATSYSDRSSTKQAQDNQLNMPTGTVIGRAGEYTPGSVGEQGQTYYSQQQSQQRQQGQQRQAQPQPQQAQAQPQPEQRQPQPAPATVAQQAPELTERELIDNYWNRASRERQLEAMKQNDANFKAYQELYGGTYNDYINSDEFVDDAEAFDFALKTMTKEHYGRLGEFETDEEGNTVPTKATRVGMDVKDTYRQDKLIDNVVRAFKIGFFHTSGERYVVDSKTGEENVAWDERVQNGIKLLCQYLGMDENSVSGQRTVFRLVTLYCSMGFDRNGKMFNQGRNEWYMEASEFADVCSMIYRSCIEHGNPLISPRRTSYGTASLRGTEIIPSGVMPKVVAQAITGPNSQLRFKDGTKPTAGDLVEDCRREWVTRTYPFIKKHLVDTPTRGDVEGRNLMGQRITIEDMQQALARLDNMDAGTFSGLYDVDTALHYKLEEYKDTSAEYISAMNGKFDAEAVDAFQRAQMEEIERIIESGNQKEIGAIAVAANTAVSGIRSNALLLNVPIAASAIAEKGVGDVQTDMAIRSLSRLTGVITKTKRSDVSQEMRDAFKTEEAHKAIGAALLIMDAAGPMGLADFSKTGQPLTEEAANKYIREKVMPRAKTERAAKMQAFQRKQSKIQQMVMTGDVTFKNYDSRNFLNALLTYNQVLIGAQEKLAKNNMLDQHAGMALTGQELSDIFMANQNDVSRFLTEIIGTAAGRDALMMMRTNNIGNFNPVGYTVDKILRDHAVSNALITTFFDSFPKYGINFLYALAPFSRSISYLEMKRREANGDITAGMFTIGGNLADVSKTNSWFEAMKDPAFRAGLRMNVMFDAMTFGRWSITTIILGGVMALLGFEPPEEKEDFLNISMWKIGGQEINLAYWLNDLTQLGLPGAYGFAAALSGQPADIAAKLALSSLYDQIDGNVVVDFIKGVKTWGKELEELERMGNDPSYVPEFNMSYGIMELLLDAADKIVPGAPLYRYAANDVFLSAWRGGDYATTPNPYKIFDKSEDWAIEVGKTKYEKNPTEVMLRRHSTSNWLLAGVLDWVNGILFNPTSKKTGYFWWEMPPKEMTDQLVLTWANSQEMDYTNREGCTTDYAYKEFKTDELIKQIEQVENDYGGIEQAIMHGYFVSHDIRYAALEILSDRLIDNEAKFQAMKESQDFGEGQDFWSALDRKKAVDNEIWDVINILKNKDLPSWNPGYKQILTDTDITFTHEDGSPALGWEYLFGDLVNNPVKAEWKNKGNHPSAYLPITFVDYSSNDLIRRGPNAETVNFWVQEGENGGTNFEAIRNGIGQQVVPMGRDEGRVLNDVLFDALDTGGFAHPEMSTTDRRAWIPYLAPVTEDILNFDVSGKVKAAVAEMKGDDSDNSGAGSDGTDNGSGNGSGNRWYRSSYSTAYPRQTYGYGSRSGSGNYNPKIYSTRASSTNVYSTRSSSTRTNPNSRSVTADRAATMYSKQPQSPSNRTYLRPTFSTKGSREAYKRQDI